MGLTEYERNAYARAHPLSYDIRPVASIRRPARWAGLAFVVRWLYDRLYYRWLAWRTRRRIPHG